MADSARTEAAVKGATRLHAGGLVGAENISIGRLQYAIAFRHGVESQLLSHLTFMFAYVAFAGYRR